MSIDVEKIIRNIQFEINEIDNELDSFSPLIKLCTLRNPDVIETAAAAALLH